LQRLERLERLWAPHRLAYITADPARADPDGGGCPFCAIPDQDDREGLVIARGTSVYAVLNLHPYNPGHLMVVPYRHVAELEDLTDDETHDLAGFTRRAVVALKRTSVGWQAGPWPTICTSTSCPGGVAMPTS
jgi:ATP adenylyltransferase